MNVFNRILVLILALAALVAAFILTVWPQTWLLVGEYMLHFSQYARLAYILGGILVMLLCGFLLLLDVRRPRRSKYVVVDKVTGGQARVLIDSVSRRLNYEVDLLQDVSQVKSRIDAKGSGLRVTLDVMMGPDVDVPMKTDEIIETARRMIVDHMGLKLAGKTKDAITVNIRHPKQIAPARPELPAVAPAAEAPPELPDLDLAPAPELPEPTPIEEPQPEEGWKEEL